MDWFLHDTDLRSEKIKYDLRNGLNWFKISFMEANKWMFAGKTLINTFFKIHDTTLQVVYNEYNKLYEELL